MIEIRYCDRFYNIPIKNADFIIICEQDKSMSYIDIPITEIFDSFIEEHTDEKGEISEDITEDILIDYIVKELLKIGYTIKDFGIYKKII